MDIKIKNVVDRDVFTLVPQPPKVKVISCRWNLKRKLNLDGNLNKLKARLVARGFDQREGIKYQDTFAPSSSQESLKAFLTYNGIRDRDVIKLDIVGAFLYGKLDKVVYLGQPEEYVDADHPDNAWQLNKSLYGLKQSARQWHACLVNQLKSQGSPGQLRIRLFTYFVTTVRSTPSC